MVVHRRNALRASKIMQDKAIRNPKISFVWNTIVEEINDVAKGKMTGIVLRLHDLHVIQATQHGHHH